MLRLLEWVLIFALLVLAIATLVDLAGGDLMRTIGL